MIRNIHISALRDIIEQQERDLTGWRRMLALAEQEERVGAILPDPLPRPAAPGYDAPGWTVGEPLTRGAAPYPPINGGSTPVYDGLPSIDGSALPPKQENAFGTIAAEHDAYSQTTKAHKEDEKWRQA